LPPNSRSSPANNRNTGAAALAAALFVAAMVQFLPSRVRTRPLGAQVAASDQNRGGHGHAFTYFYEDSAGGYLFSKFYVEKVTIILLLWESPGSVSQKALVSEVYLWLAQSVNPTRFPLFLRKFVSIATAREL
jgi:hypothetical protein